MTLAPSPFIILPLSPQGPIPSTEDPASFLGHKEAGFLEPQEPSLTVGGHRNRMTAPQGGLAVSAELKHTLTFDPESGSLLFTRRS